MPLDADATPEPTSGTSDIVVLQLEVLIDQHHNILLLQPHAQDFLESLAVWLRGLESLARGVPQLMQHQHLQVSVLRLLQFTAIVFADPV